MLVLSRRVGQTLRIGDAVVAVVRVQGKQVRLAISAPRDVEVVREEIDVKEDSPLAAKAR